MRMVRTQTSAFVVMGLMLLTMSGCATNSLHAGKASLPHFFQVGDHLYRGGQPTAAGFRHLQAMGVKTVVSLRAHRSRDAARRRERELVESLGMRWVSLPMRMYWRPSDAQVQTFLALTANPDSRPVFIHCQHGEDRTGSLVAIYRVATQGWRPNRAYREALALGLAGWNPFVRTLILSTPAPGGLRTAALSQ